MGKHLLPIFPELLEELAVSWHNKPYREASCGRQFHTWLWGDGETWSSQHPQSRACGGSSPHLKTSSLPFRAPRFQSSLTREVVQGGWTVGPGPQRFSSDDIPSWAGGGDDGFPWICLMRGAVYHHKPLSIRPQWWRVRRVWPPSRLSWLSSLHPWGPVWSLVLVDAHTKGCSTRPVAKERWTVTLFSRRNPFMVLKHVSKKLITVSLLQPFNALRAQLRSNCITNLVTHLPDRVTPLSCTGHPVTSVLPHTCSKQTEMYCAPILQEWAVTPCMTDWPFTESNQLVTIHKVRMGYCKLWTGDTGFAVTPPQFRWII